MAPFYEIIIYTASQRCYADRLLNIIDSEQHLIDHRLYREHCLYIDGNYVKDLNALNRDLVMNCSLVLHSLKLLLFIIILVVLVIISKMEFLSSAGLTINLTMKYQRESSSSLVE